MPCARYFIDLYFLDSFSKILINKFPIIFLFFSGFCIFLSFFRNILDALINFTLSLYFFLNISYESLNSFFLISPVSTITHIRFFLIALLINKATTLLSTPPDNAQITLSFLTVFLISLINLFASEATRHFFLTLHIENKKFLKISFPLSVCVTSG